MNNSYIKIKVKGKNVNNYLKWLIKEKINIININIVNHNELLLLTEYQYYQKLKSYSKTYSVSVIKKYGKLRFIEFIKTNIIILASILLAIILLYTLSNYIFSIDIIYNDKEIVNKLQKELAQYDITRFKKKKTQDYLEKVKKDILKNNKDTLEWIEIEEDGTKYIVKLVERKKEVKENEYTYQSIIASKNATITSIKAYSGEKVKTVNQYVQKGETIISGVMQKPDGTNIFEKAKGRVYGEVWYKVNLEYPLYYQEEKVTGKNKTIITINFLDKQIPLFPYKKYKQLKHNSSKILESKLLPISLTKENLYEVIVKEEIYTEEKAVSIAKKLAEKKLKEKNNKIIEINDIQILEKVNLGSKIKLNLFISVNEDITEIIEVKEEMLEKPNK